MTATSTGKVFEYRMVCVSEQCSHIRDVQLFIHSQIAAMMNMKYQIYSELLYDSTISILLQPTGVTILM